MAKAFNEHSKLQLLNLENLAQAIGNWFTVKEYGVTKNKNWRIIIDSGIKYDIVIECEPLQSHEIPEAIANIATGVTREIKLQSENRYVEYKSKTQKSISR